MHPTARGGKQTGTLSLRESTPRETPRSTWTDPREGQRRKRRCYLSDEMPCYSHSHLVAGGQVVQVCVRARSEAANRQRHCARTTDVHNDRQAGDEWESEAKVHPPTGAVEGDPE